MKINYLYYFSKAFTSRSVQGTQVPVRYDPFNIGLAYAYVAGRWVQCICKYYLQLRGHTERELQFVSSEVRKRYQKSSWGVSRHGETVSRPACASLGS